MKMKNRKQLHRLQQHENTQPPGKNKFSFLSHSLFLFRQIVARRRLELLAFFYFDSFIFFFYFFVVFQPNRELNFFFFSIAHAAGGNDQNFLSFSASVQCVPH